MDIEVKREKMKKTSKNLQKAAKPGPKPQRLKIEGDWKDAVKLAMQKKKPAEGWSK